jgi:hypothetical protein
MVRKPILLGLVAMLTIQCVAETLMAGLGTHQSLYGSAPSILVAVAAASAGGWIAQRRFLLPALLLWATLWCAIVYLLYRVAAPAGDAAPASILIDNATAIACSCAATVLGVTLGQWAGRRRMPVAAAG